jgi:hypothetical protein
MRNYGALLCCAAVLALCAGCGGKPPRNEPPPGGAGQSEAVPQPVCRWFCFDRAGFSEIPDPQSAPPVPFAPWTEAVRVADAGIASGAAYFLMNRLGLLVFSGVPPSSPGGSPDIRLIRDDALFLNLTAAGLPLVGGVPLVHLYRNDFFASGPSAAHPVLAAYDREAGRFIPALDKSGLSVPENAEVIDLAFGGGVWYGAIKQTIDGRITYSYRQFEISAAGAPLPVQITGLAGSSAESFRAQKEPLPFAQAPERLRSLLGVLPADLPFEILCVSDDTPAPRVFLQGAGPDTPAVYGSAALASSYAAALFADGTFYFAGLLPRSGALPRSVNCAFRLPALPPGFAYGRCIVSGDTLFAAWEEADFYQTGRSGFAALALDGGWYGQ